MHRRRLLIGFLVATTTMTLAPAAARAQAGPALMCEFSGLAGSITDDANGSGGIDSIRDDISDIGSNPRTTIDIEHGTYDYGGPARCSGYVAGVAVTPNADGSSNAWISSQGEYHNVLCGTGYASDVDGAQTVIDLGWTQLRHVAYEIPFMAGQGAILIGSGQESTNPHDAPGTRVTGSWTGEGEAKITPDDDLDPNDGGDNCVTVDTNEFQVTGEFKIVPRAPVAR